jgi:hypothetical protein
MPTGEDPLTGVPFAESVIGLALAVNPLASEKVTAGVPGQALADTHEKINPPASGSPAPGLVPEIEK